MLTSRRRRRAEMLISLPLLQVLLQLVPLFLDLLFGLLGIIYFLHAHPDSAPGPGDHAGQRGTGGHREDGKPLFRARNHMATISIHGCSVHPALAFSVAWSFHWRLNSA